MKEKKGKISRKGLIVSILMLIYFAFMFFPLMTFTSPSFNYSERLDIDSGWHVETAAETYEDVTISETQFPMQNRGDYLIMSRRIPSDASVENPVLCVYSIHCYIKVYLDDDLVYDYGNNSVRESKLPGYGVNVVELPSDYAGRNLTIEYDVEEDEAFEGLQAPYIMDGNSRMRYLLASNRFGFVCTVLLIMLGFIGMLAAIIMVPRAPVFTRIYWLSLFSLSIGLWSMCNNDLMSLFIQNISDKSYVEYAAFYIMTIPFLCYFHDRVIDKALKPWIKIYYAAVLSADLVFYFLVNLFQIWDIAHFPKFVIVEHVFLVLSILFFILLNVAEHQAHKRIEPRIFIGFAIATFMALEEMIRFNLQKYIIGFAGNKFNSTLAICALIIVVTLFLDFGDKISDALYRDTRSKVLQHLAYIDELTCLNNRRRYEEEIERLEGTNKKFAIVNMDMNLLKAINDTYGHEAGDRALASFSQVLLESFPSDALICRMGGDEFTVLMYNASEAETQKCIKAMLKEMDRRNSVNDEITLSTAYGCAYSSENASARLVYKLADQRMYANKKESHLGRE